MSDSSPAYPLGGTETEKNRLLRQAVEYHESAGWMLDRIGVQDGWSVADIGCGPIGILDLLSERVGRSGKVVGVERELRFANMALDECRHRKLGNVEIVISDGLNTGLEPNSFDLVHERLVLLNVADRPSFLKEMVSIAKGCGVIALEDIDNISWACFPSHPSWNILLNTFHVLFHRNGGNGFMGRELPHWLRAAGIPDPMTKIHAQFAEVGTYRRTHLLSLIQSLRDKIVGEAIMTAATLDSHCDALRDHLSDPNVAVIDKLLIQSWGVKPR